MPSSRIFAFDDPESYQRTVRAAKEVRVMPTTRGHFYAELLQIDLHRLWMQHFRESLPRIAEASGDADRAAILFPLEGPGFRHRGIDVSPGDIVVEDCDLAHYLSRAPGRMGAMSLTPTDLAAAGRVLVGRELTVPRLAHIVRPPPAHMTRLLDLHGQAAQLARSAPDVLARSPVARALEEALIHAMLRCLTEGTVIEMDARGRCHMAAVSRFEEFLGGLISLAAKELANLSQALTHAALSQSPTTKILRPPARAVADLMRLHTQACRLAETKPDIIVHREVTRALEHDLLYALVHCLTADEAYREADARQRHAEIMARFEEALASPVGAPRSMPEMAATVGVLEQTLRRCCKKFLGMSPSRYVRLRQLNQVRAALRRADPATASIGAIVNLYGITELGRFSVAYRAIFGESPSTTLRRFSTVTEFA